MARSTREAILTAAAELMRRKGYGAVGMKDIAAASGAPIGSLYHHFRDGKVQIAREALVNAGVAYGLLIPTLVDPHDDLGEAIESVFAQAAEDMASTGFANMCPVASVAAEIADTVEELRSTSAAVFNGWLDGGTAYFVARGLPESQARDVTTRDRRRPRGRVRAGQDAAQHRAAAISGPGACPAVQGSRPDDAHRDAGQRLKSQPRPLGLAKSCSRSRLLGGRFDLDEPRLGITVDGACLCRIASVHHARLLEQMFTEGVGVRVMGVDPGLTRCGLSVIEGGTGRQVIALDVDVVRTPSDAPLHQRLLTISDAVEHWMDTHHPDVVAIERVFSQQNVSTVMGTAQAGGVIALAAAKRGIDVHFHTPSEVKAAVTGNGGADKAQVTAMVTRILALQTKPAPADAADALALAICHCWRAPMIARMAAAEAQAAEQQKKYRARLKAAR